MPVEKLGTWSESEKKLARRLFDAALEAELNDTISEFKTKASAVASAGQMWELESFLSARRRDIDAKYEYRYSQLLFVFGRLVREGRISREQLRGLAEEKLQAIDQIFSL